jgi:hypothetical protein
VDQFIGGGDVDFVGRRPRCAVTQEKREKNELCSPFLPVVIPKKEVVVVHRKGYVAGANKTIAKQVMSGEHICT